MRHVAILLLTVVVFFTGVHAASRDYPNLVYNHSFEQRHYYPAFDRETIQSGDYSKQLVFEHWFVRSEMTADPDVVHSGNYSLRLTGPVSGYTFAIPHLILKPGTEYKLSAWFRTSGDASLKVTYAPQGTAATTVESRPDTARWHQVSKTFTMPEAPEGMPQAAWGLNSGLLIRKSHMKAMLRINWDVKEGQIGWIDDVSITPVDGPAPIAPKPNFITPPGTYSGPIHVEITTDLPDAEIYYTVDGTEPDIFSNAYQKPFRVMGPAVIRARTCHTAYQESPEVTASYDIKAKVGEGVPFNPAGWDKPVDQWWDNHIYNPDSPNHFTGPVLSPRTWINVADVRDKNPDTTTAGIAEALAQLPQSGGTLYFPKDRGPYIITKGPEEGKNYYSFQACMLVWDRSNLHFVSDGATIKAPSAVFAFSTTDYQHQIPMHNPITNFYFNNIHFDGSGTADQALYFQNSAEVLIENCTFTNYGPARRGHPGVIHAHAMSDNIWVRNCTFESGNYGIFLDGVHGCGAVNCTFGDKLRSGGILVFTNNDMCTFSAFQRSTQYFVADNCTFRGSGESVGVIMTTANAMVSDCTATGQFHTFVRQIGRGRSNMRHMLFYNGQGIRILNNKVENAQYFAGFDIDIRQHTRPDRQMKTIIAGNTCDRTDYFLTWAGQSDPHYPFYSHFNDVTVTNNTFAGDHLPQVRVPGERTENIRDIDITGNTLIGQKRPIIVNEAGKEIDVDAIRIRNNQIRQR